MSDVYIGRVQLKCPISADNSDNGRRVLTGYITKSGKRVAGTVIQNIEDVTTVRFDEEDARQCDAIRGYWAAVPTSTLVYLS